MLQTTGRALRRLGLVWTLSLGGLGLVGCGTEGASAGVASAQATGPVSPERARALVAEGATLLDVRTPAEWSEGHLDAATLIPVQELAGRMGELSRDRPVVVYCRSGVRSARAAEMLRGAGYEVHDLGAMSRWGA